MNIHDFFLLFENFRWQSNIVFLDFPHFLNHLIILLICQFLIALTILKLNRKLPKFSLINTFALELFHDFIVFIDFSFNFLYAHQVSSIFIMQSIIIPLVCI